MVMVNIYEAKTHLSRLLKRVRAGEEVIVAEAGKPVARLVPYETPGPRNLGGDEGKVWVADDFDAPLPEEILEGFYGRPPHGSRAVRGRSAGRSRRS